MPRILLSLIFITTLSLPACTSTPRTTTSTTAANPQTPSILLRGQSLPSITLPTSAFVRKVHHAGSLVFIDYTITSREHNEIHNTRTSRRVELASPIKSWEHIGDSWFHITTAGGTSALYRVDGDTLTKFHDLPNPIFAASATSTHVAVLEQSGALTMYEVEADALVGTYVTRLKLAHSGVDLPAMTWVTPHDLLALTVDPAINTTIIFDHELAPLVTIDGRLMVNNSALARGILPLANERGDRTDLVQVDSTGRLKSRTRIPGALHYVYMPSPDATQAILTSPGLLKGNRHAIITIDASATPPALTISPALDAWPIGWHPATTR
jgi:hypothetical protein